MHATEQTEQLIYREPKPSDGAAVWNLIRRCPPLDVNSGYSYLLLCERFADTCVVCEVDGEIVGFVSGFLPPTKPDCLFIWQVAVDERMRGKGLGPTMILRILGREFCRHVQSLETTVSPSNEASRRMFQSVAKSLKGNYHEDEHFDSAIIPEDGHESENLVTIGPFSAPILT